MSNIKPAEVLALFAICIVLMLAIFSAHFILDRFDSKITYTKSVVSEIGPCGASSCAAKDINGNFIQLYKPAMVGQTVYLYCNYKCNKYWSVEAPKDNHIEKD